MDAAAQAAEATPPLRAGVIPPGGVYVNHGRTAEIPPEAFQAAAAARQAAQPARELPELPENSPRTPIESQRPSAEPPPGRMTDTGAGDARHCPHCGWDQARVDVAEATEFDKQTYLISVLGSPDARFTKEYPLYAGKVIVTFQSLGSDEEDQILHQVALDWRHGKLRGDVDWVQRWMDYRMALSLQTIAVEDVGKTYVAPVAVEYDRVDGEVESPAPALWDHLNGSILRHSGLRRAASLAFASFVDLNKRLEANYDNPDFWQGIEAHA
jgi:hypothetical protein